MKMSAILIKITLILFVISLILSKYKRKNSIRAFFDSSIILLYFIITILYFVADYFTNEGINETVMFTIIYGLNGAGFGEYYKLIFVSVMILLILILFSIIYFKKIREFNVKDTLK